MPASATRRRSFGVTTEELTSVADLPFVDRFARFLGLGAVWHRRRGCRDDRMLLVLILTFWMGDGHLSGIDGFGTNTTAGLCTLPGSGRLGDFLSRLSAQVLTALQELAMRRGARRL